MSNAHEIARMLNLPEPKVAEVLEFLTQCGLAKKTGQGFKIGATSVFLKGDSPAVWKHHTNWRMKAIASFDAEPVDELHLSTVFTVAEPDVLKMKERILSCIDEVRGRIKASKEERVQCFNVDFFSLTQ